NNIKASQADYKRSKSSDLPNIDLRLATESGDDIGGVLGSKDETSLVLNLTYNFYRGGADKANQQKKISATYEQKDFAARVRRQVINTLRLAWTADTSLARQLRFLKDYTVRAKETVGLYKEEFFIGQRDLIDLLDAENELNSALNQHEEAYFDALSSRYRVYEGGGTLFEALNLDVVLTENNLMVARINANSTDDLPLPKDLDADKESDVTDHCDNSLQNVGVNDYGCLQGNGGFKINSAPVAVDDEIELEGNSVLLITQSQILENDRDGDGDSLSVTGIGEVSNGQIAFDENKNIIYKPTEGFAGNDFFKYSLSDGNGGFSEATVALVVHATDNIDLCKHHYVNFVYGRTGLTDISTSKLQDIIDKIKDEKDVKIVFYAHTDSIGSDRYNKVLSQRRADAVKKLLVDNGIAAEIITVEGMGERMPIADNKYKAGRAINRRGEFVFLTDNDTASP
ncbi:MAG: OmpA family protein, partial [Colwellia sp.]|nr:OmpA family protein [Colwellia sp.]